MECVASTDIYNRCWVCWVGSIVRVQARLVASSHSYAYVIVQTIFGWPKTKDMNVLTHSLPSTLGPWSVVLYDSLARVSGRYSIICYNFLLITRLECLEHILTSSFVRKYLLDTSNIVNANVRLHSWNGIGLCVMTLLHVWSILFPCITHGYTAVVVPGVWEWPASERTPVKCSVSDEPGCWPGDANPGENTLYDCNENDLCLCI